MLRKVTPVDAQLIVVGPPTAMFLAWAVWLLSSSSGPSFLSSYYHPLAALKRQCLAYPTCPFPAEAIATLYVAQTFILLLSLVVLTAYMWAKFEYRGHLWPNLFIVAFWVICLLDFYYGLFDDGDKRSTSNTIAHSGLGVFHFAVDYSLCWLAIVGNYFFRQSKDQAVSPRQSAAPRN